MASFPPLPQIAGKHAPVFEAYYRQADPTNSGSIGALDAANFMKKSGLNDKVLSQIWDLSDPTGKGYLEKQGFYVALKLISLAQNGQEVAIAKLPLETPQPNLGPVELAPEGEAAPGGPWAIGAGEKSKYDQVFDSLQPVNNLLAGDRVKPVLMNSKLPVDVLGKIWELSDIDKDGYLDRDEFALAMHLVHKGMAKEAIPNVVPPNLIPPSKRKGPLPGAVPVLPGLPGSGRNTPVTRSDSPSLRGQPAWVVTPAEKLNYDQMFRKADLDMDGFVSGQEIRDIFLQSGLQNQILAHIWNLSDMKGMGKLNSEQFALAMYLVQQKIKGIDPPAQLTPEMIPPSFRTGATTADTAAFGVADGVTSAGPYGHVADFSAIKELDMIQKEIDEIKKEKLKLEAEQQQQTADIRLCQVEVQTLEKELNNITGTLHQLENQKIEAQKILDELEEKKMDLETSVREIKQKCDEEQKQIDTLNNQLQNQQKSALEQDEELNRLRIELSTLREQENTLEQKVENGKTQLEQLNKSHKDVLLQVNQTKTRVQHLQDQHRAIQQGITEFTLQADSPAFGGSTTGSLVEEQASSTRATQGSPVSTISDFSMGSAGFDEDPFKNKDPFGNSGSQADPFSEDPFKSNDPFKSDGFTSDPFASDDMFKDAFPTTTSSSNKDDPFFSSDPFGSGSFSSSTAGKQTDAFDPFGTGSSSTSKTQRSSGDLFGSDPFAPSPPNKSRSESPRPALPPKQKKAPPPRPAPPKKSPASSPSRPSKPDPFGSAFPNDPFGSSDPFSGSVSGGGGDAFANFADFSPSKTSNAFNDDAWGVSPSAPPMSSPSSTQTSSSKKSKSSGSKSSHKKKTMTREEQEEADYQYALKLSRGEIQ